MFDDKDINTISKKIGSILWEQIAESKVFQSSPILSGIYKSSVNKSIQTMEKQQKIIADKLEKTAIFRAAKNLSSQLNTLGRQNVNQSYILLEKQLHKVIETEKLKLLNSRGITKEIQKQWELYKKIEAVRMNVEIPKPLGWLGNTEDIDIGEKATKKKNKQTKTNDGEELKPSTPRPEGFVPGSPPPTPKNKKTTTAQQLAPSNDVVQEVNAAMAGMFLGKRMRTALNTMAGVMPPWVQDILSAIMKLPSVFGALGAPLTILTGGVTLLIMALKIFIGGLTDSYKEIRTYGTLLKQTSLLIHKATEADSKAMQDGLIRNIEETTKVVGSLAAAFQSIDIKDEYINNARLMVDLWKISIEDAAKLTNAFDILYRGNSAAVLRSTDLITAVADAQQVPVQLVADAIAKNSELLYRAGRRGADAYIQSAAALTKARMTPQDIAALNNFADKMVSDFDAFLQTQAEMQTAFPGFDLTSTMLASQFGTQEDVQKALKSALMGAGITDLGQMPRSFQVMLQKNLGLSYEQLAKIMGVEVQDPVVSAIKDQTKIQNAQLRDMDNLAENGFIGSILLQIKSAVVDLAKFLPDALAPLKFIADAINEILRIISLGTLGHANPAKEDVSRTDFNKLSPTDFAWMQKKATATNQQDLSDALSAALAAKQKDNSPEAKQWLSDLNKASSTIKYDPNKDLSTNIEDKMAISGFDTEAHINIPKHHSGGIVSSRNARGPKQEVPAILQAGEAILSRSQLAGLRKMMEAIKGIGSIGKMASSVLGGFDINSIRGIFGGGNAKGQSGGLLGGLTGILGGLFGGGKNGNGILGAISGLFGNKKGGGVLGALGGLFGGLGKTATAPIMNVASSGGGVGGLLSSLGGLFGGGTTKSGGILGAISNLFKSGSGGILGSIGKLFSGGGGLGGIFKGVTGLFGGGGISSLLGGFGSKLLGGLAGGPAGLLASFAGPLLSKIPVIGNIFGGVSNIVGSLGKTVLGGAIKTVSSIAKGIGGVAKKIGGFFGGLFGKKKKKEPTAPPASAMPMPSMAMQYPVNSVPGAYYASMQGGSALQTSVNGQVPYGIIPPGSTAPAPATSQPVASSDAVVAKLDELIRLMKSGGISVVMDGRKVSEQILTANSKV